MEKTKTSKLKNGLLGCGLLSSISLIGEAPDTAAVIDQGAGKALVMAVVNDKDVRGVLSKVNAKKSGVAIRIVGGVAKEAKGMRQERQRGGMGR